jgi:hypothetical protein
VIFGLNAKVWFDQVKKEIDRAVNLVGRGRTAKFLGTFPEKYLQLIDPSNDPESYFHNTLLERHHYALPPLKLFFRITAESRG